MRTFTQKLAFLLVALLCCIGMPIRATEVTIGDLTGTSTSQYLPLYTFYNYSITQQIYTAEEIEEAGGGAGTITSLKLYLYKVGSIPTLNVQIYMKEVDQGSFTGSYSSGYDWIDLSEDDLVYSSDKLTVTNSSPVQEYEFVLDQPFTYEGTGNLLICINNITGSYAPYGNYLYGLTETQSSDGAIYSNNDSGAYDVTNMSSSSGNTLSSRNVITLDITSSSSGPVCGRPESLDITDISADGAMLNFSGGSGVYNVEYKASTDADWSTATKNTSLTSYTLTGLTPNTSYSVRVQSVCGDNTSSYRAASFRTLIGIPYLETFDKSSAPEGWSTYTGTLNDDGSATLSSSTYDWSFGEGSSYGSLFGSSHAYGYCSSYSSASYQKWLVSPSIPLEDNLQLSFDLGLTNSSGNAVTKGNQTGLQFVVLVSYDGGNNWVELRRWNNDGTGDDVFDDISATGEEIEIPLAGHTSGNAQFAFHLVSSASASSYSTYIHIDNVRIGYVPTCLKPTLLHEVAGMTTSTSVQVGWTANTGETAWRVQYKPSADAEAEWITFDAETNPFTISGLQPFTSYDVRVAAACSETDVTDYGKILSVKTAAGVPFAQSFNATSLPADWKRYKALFEEVQFGAELTPVTSGWTVSSANGVFPSANRHLVLNIKDSTANWILSPVIEMEEGYRLAFDLALTTSAGSSPVAVTPGAQNDDKFYVLVSTDGGDSWSVLGQWDNEGGGFSFDAINAEGQTVKFDLSAYASRRIIIALYGESTDAQSASSNNLHIANLKVEQIPDCEKASSLVITNINGTSATAVWETEEDGTWQYGFVVKPDDDFVPTDDRFTGTTDGLTAQLTGLSETTTYLFFLRRVCDGSYSEVLTREFSTIQTPAGLPYSQDFETDNGWLLLNGNLTNQWVRDTAASNGGSYALYISDDNGETNGYDGSEGGVVYASKTFYFDEPGTYIFSYDWRANGESNYGYLRVALVPVSVELAAETYTPSGFDYEYLPAGWKALDGGSKLNLKSAWQQQTVELAIEEIGYYKMVFAWYNDDYGTSHTHDPAAAVDNISISRLLCPQPTGLQLSEVNYNDATISWNEEPDGLAWVYALVPAAEPAPADEDFEPVDVNSITLPDLTESTKYVFYLRKACDTDIFSETVSLSFMTRNPNELIVNDGTTTSIYAPVYGLYVDDITTTQFIIPAASLATLAWDTITSLTFFSSYNEISWGDAQFEVYMAEVPETTLSDLKSWSSLTKVRNAGSLSVDNKTMTVALDAPFLYQGGNLLIGFNQTKEGSSAYTSWYGVSASYGASYYSYFDDYYSEYSYGASFLPKTAIGFKHGEVPACFPPADLHAVDSLTTTSSAVLTWAPAGTETKWVVRYRTYGEEEWEGEITCTTDSAAITGLNPATTYEAQVAATACDPVDPTAVGDFSASATFVTDCDIITAFPYSTNFDNLTVASSERTLPACWSAINTTSYSSYQIYPTVYYSSYYPEYANSQPNFLRFYSYNYPGSTSTYDPQDQYAVLPQMADINTLRIKFNARKYDTYDATLYIGVMTDPEDPASFVGIDTINPAATAYAPFEVRFNNYEGEGQYIALKMPAATTSTRAVHVDDIVVEEIPACSEVQNLRVIADSITPNSAALTWDARNGEENWKVRYRIQGAQEWSDTLYAASDTFSIASLIPATAYEVQVAAWCDPTDEEAVSPFSMSMFFVTDCDIIASFPYNMNFDDLTVASSGRTLPACWSAINTTSYSSMQVYPAVYSGSSYANSQPNYLRFYSYNYPGYTSTYDPQDQYAVLPQMENISTLRIKFNARKYDTYDATLYIGVMTDPEDPASFVGIDTINPATATYAPFEVRFYNYAGEGQYIALKMPAATGSARYVFVDDIVVEELPSCLEPDGLTAVLTQGDGSVATLNWNAGAATAWVLEYSLNADFSDADSKSVSGDATAALTGLTAEATYYARVKVVCGEGNESGWSEAVAFTPTNAVALTVNNGTTTNSNVPIYGYYADYYNTFSQFVIPADSLEAVQWGTIKQLTFYVSPATMSWGTDKWEIYMTETPAATLSALADWTDMEKVMTAGTLSVADGKMVVTLTEPFHYENGNLLIGFKQTDKGTYNTVNWYGVSATGAAYYGYTSGYSDYPYQENFLPKTTIDFVPGEAPACMQVKNVTSQSLTATSEMIAWTNGDEEQNAWEIALSQDADFNPGEAALITADANPFVLGDLTAETTYYLYVRANCGSEDGTGAWSARSSFTTVSACQLPDGIAADDITISSAAVSWNTYGQTGFNLRYSTDGENWTTVDGVTSPYTINGLTPATSYAVQVQTACNTEAWSATYNFVTACDIITSFPYSMNFDNLSVASDYSPTNRTLPACWSAVNTTSYSSYQVYPTVYYYSYNANYANSQPNFLRFYSYYSSYSDYDPQDQYAVLPQMADINTLRIRLNARKYDSSYDATLYVGVMTDPEDTASFVLIGTINPTSTAYAPFEVRFNYYEGEGQYIALKMPAATTSTRAVYVDDIVVEKLPTCLEPGAVSISEIAGHSAKISWTNGTAAQTAWQIACSQTATNEPDTLPGIIDVTENPYVLTGLDPETRYYIYVRANCGEGDLSPFATGIYFTTTVACPAPAGVEAVLTPGNGTVATLNWTAGGAAAWTVEYSLHADLSDSTVVEVTEPTCNLTNLTAETTCYARVKANCGDEDGESLYSAVISFKPTDAFELLLNDGTATNGYVPVYGYFVDNATQRSQFVVPAAQLEALEWDSIKSLTFYASEADVNWGAATFEAYVLELDEAALAAEQDWTQMTKVMNETSLSVAGNKMVVTFDEAYQYQGENLLIGIKTVVKGTYKSVNWYGVTAAGAALGGYGTTLTNYNFLPKMLINYVPGVAPACPGPKNLTVSDITDSEAVFSWKAVEGATWEYALVEGTAEPAAFTATNEASVTFSELAEATGYTFYLRRNCGEDGYSDQTLSLAFTTDVHSEALPFDEDFETPHAWKFVNATEPNAWVIGDAVSNGGDKALYISNNAGADNTYTKDEEAAVFATILLNFDKSGTYTFAYDWKVAGDYDETEGELYDYLRVALVPADAVLTAGTPLLPAGYIALDGGGLYGATEWQHHVADNIAVVPGLYKLVFAWFNDESDGEDAPAAIDNISIRHKAYATDIQSGAGIGNKAVKFLHNNQVYILLNGNVYNITGQKVELK